MSSRSNFSIRPPMGATSGEDLSHFSKPSKPSFCLRVGKSARQTCPDPRVILDVHSSHLIVRRIPHLGGDLVRSNVLFEGLFVASTVPYKPIRSRITHSVAEHGVQSPGYLVYEVIHIALETAVVIAGE